MAALTARHLTSRPQIRQLAEAAVSIEAVTAGKVIVVTPPAAQPAENTNLLLPRLRHAAANPLSYDQMLGTLGRYSMVTATADTIDVHRLLQAWVRAGLDQNTRRRWAGVAVHLVWAAFPADASDVRRWPTSIRLLPHAIAAADHASGLGADPRATAGLLNHVGGYLWWRAELARAWEFFDRAHGILEAQLSADHPDMANNLDNLGIVFRRRGNSPRRATPISEPWLSGRLRWAPDADVPDVAMSTTDYFTSVDRSEGISEGTSAVAPLMRPWWRRTNPAS
jgi:hypothetical protein